MQNDFSKHFAVCAAALFLTGAPALAQDAQDAQDARGEWLRDNGRSRVRIGNCGEHLCGTISWLADRSGPSKVGQRVLYNMKQTGAGKWSGNAFNPEDGKTYSGSMTISGNALITSGCVLGGLICRSVNWTRTK